VPRPSPSGAVLLAIAFLLSACGGAAVPTPSDRAAATPQPTTRPTPPSTPTPSPLAGTAPQGETVTARVVSVVDGDTIKVEIDGIVFPLRYIGMDSPETHSPTKPLQWMGPEATLANQSLVEGQTVVLERDVSETDQFDRLLRYVWIERGDQWLMVNRELVRLGFAVSKAYPPDTKYQSLLDAAQQEARAAQVALWSATPTPAPTAVPPPPVTPAPPGNCDPSYPSVCIPPPPPDLDCGDISFRRFTVLPPDPHGFDGDDDGIGCESG
jgi:micrococcal nuclease